jgi:hypothetical protein
MESGIYDDYDDDDYDNDNDNYYDDDYDRLYVIYVGIYRPYSLLDWLLCNRLTMMNEYQTAIRTSINYPTTAVSNKHQTN